MGHIKEMEVHRMLSLPKRLFQTALQSNYTFAKAYHQLKMLPQGYGYRQQPVVVHQMGKVASTAIYESLKELNSNDYIFYHTHYLSDQGLQDSEQFYRENYCRIKAVHTALAHSFHLRRFLKSRKSKRIKVITLVRDPIAKNVSSFFQNLRYWFNISISPKKFSENPEDTLNKLGDLFINEFPRHDVPLLWLDTELKPVFGIDVFEYPFKLEQGYQIYQGDRADVLLLKLECLNEIVTESMEAFLSVKEFQLKPENIGADKDYAHIYRSFKQQIKLPEAYLDHMYGSKYVQHFYSQQEIDAFRAKWQ